MAGWRRNTLRGANHVEMANGSTVSNKTNDRVVVRRAKLFRKLALVSDGCLHPYAAPDEKVAEVAVVVYT